ncbi:unnamed protein product, partial [Sphagnum compactum]
KWYLRNIDKFTSWNNLKKRFQEDLLQDKSDDFLLDEAHDRKQKEDEFLTDFIEDMQSIFDAMDDPPSEKRMIHITKNNMLSEFQLQLVN